MFLTEYESANFAWEYDALYGVGRFRRKSDGKSTLLETGGDCAQVRISLIRLARKTSSKKYPKSAPSFSEVFDCIASEYEYQD